MRKDGKKKVIPLFVTMILLLSLVTIMPQSAVATEVKVSDDGSLYGLSPGDEITIEVTDGTLTEDEEYTVTVWDGTQHVELEDGTADSKGDLFIDINVPGYHELMQDPIDTWNLSLWDETGTLVDEVDIDIWNYYKVKVFVAGEEQTSLLWNKTYTDLEFKFYNWSGTDWDLVEDEDADLDVWLLDPETPLNNVLLGPDSITGSSWNPDFKFDYEDTGGNLETPYWIYIENQNDAARSAYAPVFVKLDMDVDPADVDWDDTARSVTGYLYDGTENYVGDYDVAIVAPLLDGYEIVDQATTSEFTGKFTLYFTPMDHGAGTWYVGTYMTGGTYRINETNDLNLDDFIAYASFTVETDDSAKVKVEDPDEVITGFDQTINISVYDSWDGDYFDDMNLHITGIDCYYDGTEYDSKEIVVITATLAGYSANDKYAYYEFDILFNETGIATVIATWELDNDDYTDNDNDNTDLTASISGQTTFSVVAADDMNVIIEDPPTEVVVDDGADEWINGSNPTTTINVYGDNQAERMDADIFITGCGLDIEIEEDDADYRTGQGIYEIDLAPKTGGTLTFRVVNDTEELEVTKDYTVSGLKGTVTTSVGDDLFITVQEQETITANVASGGYAEVRVSYFDSGWANEDLANSTEGDAETEGEGKDGEFTFIPDEDFVENVGYLVVAAKNGDYFMYDIIEIEPKHDLVVDMITPDEGNQTLTVGIETDIEVQILGPDGEPVDDCDTVTGQILDEEDEVLQEFDFDTAPGEGMWDAEDQILWWPGTLLITAVNNTDENEHDGNETFTVELADVTFTPSKLTCGIELENITVEILVLDANGHPLEEGTMVYLNEDPGNVVVGVEDGDDLTLDEDGKAEFDIDLVRDAEGTINVTFEAQWVADTGNETSGELSIEFPTFNVKPSEIYVGKANTITITATDAEGAPIPGINLTLISSMTGMFATEQPDPVQTDANGKVTMSLSPQASGKLNVTIARNLTWVAGQLQWDNEVITDTIINVTSQREMKITVSKSPIFEGETLTVTITSDDEPVEGVSVTFNSQTPTTNSEGKVTFEIPDPGVDSAIYTINAEKTGYVSAEKSITVINVYDITIVGPSGKIEKGKTYTFTVIAQGSALAGATVTLNGDEYTSDGEGKVSIKMSSTGEQTITATFPGDGYKDGSLTITVKKASGTPGFELLTLIIAIGVAFILIRRRRK